MTGATEDRPLPPQQAGADRTVHASGVAPEGATQDLYQANLRLILETEVVRAALAETEALRMREAAALRERSILSEALAALSGKTGAAEAMQALLEVLRREFDVFDACFLQAAGGSVRVAAAAHAGHAGLLLPLRDSLLHRPRRMAGLGALADGQILPGETGTYVTAILAPLSIPGEGAGALLLASQQAGRFTTGDLRLLERVSGLAAQALIALREARRNALLVSLIEGRQVDDPGGGVLDAPLEAVHRAFARLTDMQGEVVGILDALLSAPLSESDAAIAMALSRMGQITLTDRVYVFRLRESGDLIDNTHEWCAEGIEPARDMLQGIPVDIIGHWRAVFDAGQEVLITDVAGLPDTSPEKAILVAQGIQSLLTVPMMQDGQFRGFVGYDAVRARRTFLPGEVHLIRSVAKVIASLFARREAQERLIAAHAETQSQRTRLEAVLAAMPDLIVELDREGRFVTWHSGAITVDDKLAAAFTGRLPEEVLAPDLAAEARAIITELVDGGTAVARSIPFTLAGTDERWWQLSASRMGEDGFLFVMRDITEARAQTAEIERLSEIARRTTNLVVVTDRERRIEWVNAAFERTTGWTLAEVKGRTAGTFLESEATDPATVAAIRAALDAGEAVQAEVLNRTRDGRDYWVAVDIQPLYRIDGVLQGFMAVQTDVTERHAQAVALREVADAAAQARATLEAAVAVLQDGFVLYDADDRLAMCNDRYREFHARSAPAIVPGATFESILRYGLARQDYADAIGQEEDWLAQTMARHRDPESEIEQQLSDGRWLRIFEKAIPSGGRVGLSADITALKLAEQRALADRSTAMEASHDGIAITDAEGRFLYMNRAHLDMFGFGDEAEVIGKPWTTLYAPDAVEWMRAHAFPQLRAEGRWSGEIMGRARQGAAVEQDVSLTLKDDGGILCITRDISARRREAAERDRLNAALHLAQRREMVGQIAAGLAHDFNNLLATISGSASLIETAADPGSIIAAGASRIEAATGQAAALVRRLLALGARPSDRRPIDLRQAVREAADLARVSIKAPLWLSLTMPDDPVEVTADPTDILQVVLNLAINARDALAGQAGEIAISLAATEAKDLDGPFVVGSVAPGRRHVRLSVTDQGAGMTADLVSRIFQPYVSTKGEMGTGLGLAIVSSVILANGGAIRVTSAPGKGTRFEVFWPLDDAGGDATAVAPRPVEGLSGNLRGAAILVVDDQQAVLDVLTAMLETAGAEVAPSTEPADILAAVEADPGAWDLVITDYDMPGMTGAALAEAVAGHAPELPVILVTALAGIAGRAGLGFDAVLSKPVDRAALLRAAESAILTGRRARGQGAGPQGG